MILLRSILLIVAVGMLSTTVCAQTTNLKLANMYYKSAEFDKAVMYYEKVFKKNQSQGVYNNYTQSLINLERYKDAHKIIKKQRKRHPDNPLYMLDLGNVEQKMGNDSKAKKLFEKAIKDVAPNQHYVIKLARKFAQIGEIQYALDTYKKGKKVLKGNYYFNIEVADIYGQLNQHDEMIREYLDLLEINEAYIQQVQNVLNRNMTFEKQTTKNELLRVALLKRIQKHPDQTVFARLLIWMFLQQENFHLAMQQTKALDKRVKGNGNRVMSLANTCVKNKQYEIAIDGYNYVKAKGELSGFYVQCKMKLLRVKNMKIQSGVNTKEELIALDAEYTSTLEELGYHPTTIPLIRDHAELKAYHIHDVDTAIHLIQDAIGIKQISKHDKAEFKLMMGDFMLIKGEIWDASLLYSQVDKAFKYDRLGERAKFKNAKIGYYTGNFKWSKGMLDVLKGSTSKLIANDAMKLSVLITDNSTVDTTTVPLLMYARADFLIVQNRHEEALTTLDSIGKDFPGHALADEVLFQKSAIAEKEEKFELSAKYLTEIIDYYPTDILADNAVFRLAQLEDLYFKNADKAKALYQKILTDYPGSLHVVAARARFRALRGDQLN